MKKFILLLTLLLIPSVCQAIVVCQNPDGTIESRYLTGSPIPGCLYYEVHKNGIDQITFTNLYDLLRTVDQKYIKIESGFPVEMSGAEKAVVDATVAQRLDDLNLAKARDSFIGNQLIDFGIHPIAMRCLVKNIIQQINVLRTDPNTVKSEITADQAINAMLTCINTKEAED